MTIKGAVGPKGHVGGFHVSNGEGAGATGIAVDGKHADAVAFAAHGENGAVAGGKISGEKGRSLAVGGSVNAEGDVTRGHELGGRNGGTIQKKVEIAEDSYTKNRVATAPDGTQRSHTVSASAGNGVTFQSQATASDGTEKKHTVQLTPDELSAINNARRRG